MSLLSPLSRRLCRTPAGKEEFSETLKEVLKSQYPDVPVICWGHSKKGGEHGKDWHHAIVSAVA